MFFRILYLVTIWSSLSLWRLVKYLEKKYSVCLRGIIWYVITVVVLLTRLNRVLGYVATDDADDGKYFNFQKPNGEVSHSFQSSKLTAIVFIRCG